MTQAHTDFNPETHRVVTDTITAYRATLELFEDSEAASGRMGDLAVEAFADYVQTMTYILEDADVAYVGDDYIVVTDDHIWGDFRMHLIGEGYPKHAANRIMQVVRDAHTDHIKSVVDFDLLAHADAYVLFVENC